MDRQNIRNRLHRLIGLDDLHSWDVEEHIDRLAALPAATLEEVFHQIVVIWPVSYALCFAFLDRLPTTLTCLAPAQLGEWVKAVLDVYESDGLRAATHYMHDVEGNFLCRLRGEAGLTLPEAQGRLLPYLRGLAGYELAIAPADCCGTDTTTIFLPRRVTLFREQEANFTFFKFAASFQWALVTTGTFRLRAEPDEPWLVAIGKRYGRPWTAPTAWLNGFFALFPDPELATDLFLLAETVRATAFLHRRLPGLGRDAGPTRERLHLQRPLVDGLDGKGQVVEALKQWTLAGGYRGLLPRQQKRVYEEAVTHLAPLGTDQAASPRKAAAASAALFSLLAPLPGPYRATPPLAHAGELAPERAEQARRRRREENRQRFVTALAALLPRPAAAEGADAPPPGPAAGQPTVEEEAAIIAPGSGRNARNPDEAGSPADQTFITLDDQRLSLPPELQPLAREIRDDLGHLPRQYVSAAGQRAGSGIALGAGPEPTGDEAAPGPLTYDEWDFRRQGFRKNWCTLLAKELSPVGGTFVAATREKYRGQLRRLRQQFEMMRLEQRFVRRQPDGDDIDLDALIEARADLHAGLSPSERLHVRLLRDRRDISTVFLVDMSSSTEGWVSLASKEALVLMCEALAVLGDRYAIYGFSGMRRLRTELYHVKGLDEPYDDTVRGRIAAIAPREYTRMGPPIRHLTRLLAAGDARTRLLITISDGKPEDYDDYKGDYAIEDTRHALIEAKAAGIHPFCITIDRQAREYIAHMYGEVNYITIDDVAKLPLRMPRVYRTLTT